MQLTFGLHLDDRYFPFTEDTFHGHVLAGPNTLLQTLEEYLGLAGIPENINHIRIEQFRQALLMHSEKSETPFYQKSFDADQFATANRLLEWRDELKAAGWDFKLKDKIPNRLQVIAELEVLFNSELELSPGNVDRMEEVIQNLNAVQLPFEKINLIEPTELLPPQLKRLFKGLEALNFNIEKIELKHNAGKSSSQAINQLALSFDEPAPASKSTSDLHKFQNKIRNGNSAQKEQLSGDGSLIILKSKRETEAALFLAKLFKTNKDLQPLCLIPEKNRALDNAFIQEGLPSLGILSASLARPSLQILKLVSTFLWKPIDPFKILEFITLTIKPLARDLSFQLAAIMAQKPGIHNDSWFITKNNYFNYLVEKAKHDPTIDVEEIQKQYDFWFDRPRYDSGKAVPKKDVIEVFDFLQKWAYKQFEDSKEKNNSLLVLSGQSTRVKDLLEALPEDQSFLSFLELERIVRTIYEPSPIEFQPCQVGHLSYVHKNGSIVAQTPQLLWWNFIRKEPNHFFSKWYQDEINYFKSCGLKLESPEDQNNILLYHRNRPVLLTSEQLILILPENVDGAGVHPHALHDELEAVFDNLPSISFSVDSEEDRNKLKAHLKIPEYKELEIQSPVKSKAIIHLSRPEKLDQEEQETFTSLESLFYYPYKWVFKHKIKLRKSSILSVVKDVTLKGNLAHRFFELILKDDFQNWSKEEVYSWIDEKASTLLAREGAVLLMYGREPEKVAFINTVKNAIWTLISLIKNNGWSVKETEMNLEGQFKGIKIVGKADLVLERGDELAVVDLKWRGATRRKQMIKNEEDLQLVTYSKLLSKGNKWAHTAYFIIQDAAIIARDTNAFKEVLPAGQEEDFEIVNERIWQKMERTFEWRMNQFKNGEIEIRTKANSDELEEAYTDQLIDLLEMKNEDAPFDDYKTLINQLN